MRVLVYGMVGTNRGGIETYLLKMNQHMSDDIVFDYVIEQDSCLHELSIKNRGGKIYYIASRKRHPIQNIRDNIKLLKELKGNIGAVYFNLSSLSWIAPIRISMKMGYPVFTHSHNAEFIAANSGMVYRIVNAINKRRLDRYNITRLTCSKPATDFMFMKPDNVMMIYNAIKIDNFSFCMEKRLKIRQDLGIRNEFIIGFVGRLSYQKNPLYLLKILKEVVLERPNVKMMIVGDGDMLEELIKGIATLGLENHTILLGNQPNVNELMHAMDVFVLPSLHEGLPYVGIEAQTTGLQCFFANTVTKEVNVTGNVQFLSLSESAKNWKKEIVSCMDTEQDDRRRWSNYMKETNFNIENEARRLENILRANK